MPSPGAGTNCDVGVGRSEYSSSSERYSLISRRSSETTLSREKRTPNDFAGEFDQIASGSGLVAGKSGAGADAAVAPRLESSFARSRRSRQATSLPWAPS